MSLRSLAAVGALAASALVLAAAPSLLPQASARSDRPGVELAWASGTPAFLTPGGDAALQVTITTGERPEPDSGVVTLELGQATVAGLPPQCRTSGVRPTSSVRADGHLLVCNVGSLPAGVSVPVALTVRPEDTASQVGIQLGDYDNQGTVLTRPVASPAGSPVASPAASPVVPTVASPAAAPYYRLLSSPDFLNADIADLRASSWDRWAPGRPNSWNPAYERALDQVLDDWADFDPDAVTVPGDLVNGRWLRDPDHTGSFGPVDSPSRRTKAVVRAAHTYYGAWGQRFLDHDLTVHAGVGDHDLGDNPWRGSRLDDEKRAQAPLLRSLFARHFTTRADGTPRYASRPVGTPYEGTAYALRPDPEVQLVMLDVFRVLGHDIVPEVSGGQLAWLEGVLAQARADGVDWIVVQGHTPIIGPVRQGPSSGLMYRGGSASPLWSLFREYGVDAYLCGEVHASTAVVRDGIVQISHGGNFGYGGRATSRGGTSFLVSDFSAGRLDMSLYSWDREHQERGRLWQLAENRIPERVRFVSDPIEIGSVSITNNGSSSESHPVVLGRSGLLSLFDPDTEPTKSFADEAL